MELILSKYFGPCYGVSKAFEESIKANSKVKILGDIAHNKFLIDRLRENKNINTVHNTSEINEKDTVIIRTHGITLQQLKDLNKKKCKIIDQTCHNVRLVQKVAEKVHQGNKILLITGNPNHPEVIGIASRCKKTLILDSVETSRKLLENPNLDLSLCVIVSQTTFNSEKFKNICELFRQKYEKTKIYNTICQDSVRRKKEIIKISNFIDLCIVVGDKKSSNSLELFRFSKLFCESIFFENFQSFNFSLLENKKRIFITSGASVLKENVMLLVNFIKRYLKSKKIKVNYLV